jgi:hypothetical protein
MRPVSANFLAALRFGHVVVAYAGIIPAGGGAEVAVPIVSGEVTLDRTAQLRRQGSLTVPITPDLMTVTTPPIDVRTLPFGGYVKLKRGLRYGTGATEFADLGYLRIESVTTNAIGDAATLALSDRMAQIRDEVLLAPYTPTILPSAAAQFLVNDVFGAAIAYSITPGANESALVDVVWERERDTAVAYLARSAGCEAFFDALGGFVYKPVPSLSASPVWTIDASETGVLLDVTETLDRTASYNGVLAMGQPSADQPPVSALVVDSTPGSPTLWGGPFGKVARVEQNASIMTTAQATDAATALLNSGLGIARNLDLAAVPNPALEPGDVIDVVFPDGRSERHIIDALAIPLQASDAIRLASRSVLAPSAFLAEWDYTPKLKTYYGAQVWEEVADVEFAARR